VAEKPADDDKPIIIKKYANRRLYNTSTASFVTLDDLHEMVKAGTRFTVIDAQSSSDITCSVLAQIIADEENRGHNMLPPNYLRQVLKLYNDGIGPQLSAYLETSLDTFTANQQQMIAQMARVFGSPDTMENWAEVGRRNMEMFQQSFNMFARDGQTAPMAASTTTPKPATATGDKPAESSEDEVRSLKRQLELLQKRLDAISRENP
jgi:polyhydroxyalkanoate synthesis repressor PhaR